MSQDRPEGPEGSNGTGASRLAEVGRGLRESLGALVESFPAQTRTVSEMSRWLGVTRSSCQRVILGIRAESDPFEGLQRFPGVRGLRQILTAAEQRGADGALLARAGRAVDAYADLIGEFGGSHSRLAARLASLSGRAPTGAMEGAGAEPPSADWFEGARRASMEATAAITGYRCDARVEVSIVRTMPGDPDQLEQVLASGLIGVRRQPWGMPICRMHRSIGEHGTEGVRTTLLEGDDPVGIAPGALIRGFSADVPSVTRRVEGGWLLQVFDEEGAAGSVDLVVGNAHSPSCEHPRLSAAKVLNAGKVVAVPARRLVMDVYLERGLARESVVSAGTYFMGMAGGIGNVPIDTRWFDRLPDEPVVVNLGPATRRVPTPAYARHGELVDHLFRAAGWPAERFVGFRFEVAYPVWGAEYLMTFDFAEEPSVGGRVPRA